MPRRLDLLFCLALACGGRTPSSGNSSEETGTDSSGEGSSGEDTGMKLDLDHDNDCLTDDDCAPGYSCVDGWCVMGCGSAEAWLETPRIPVIWVVDRSASMATSSWDHDDDPATPMLSRWAQAHHFIESVSTQYGGALSFGVKLVPGDEACSEDEPDCYDNSACALPSALEWLPDPLMPTPPDQYLPLMPPADATTELRGGSPLSTALLLAAEEGTNDLGIQPLMVLVTDAMATCAPQTDCEGPGACPLLETEDPSVLQNIQLLRSQDEYVAVVGVGIDDQPSGAPYDEPDADRAFRLNDWALAGLPQGTVDGPFAADDPDAFIAFGSDFFFPGSYLPSCSFDLSEPPNTPPNADQLDLLECYVGDDDTPLPYMPELTEEECNTSTTPAWTWAEPGITLILCGIDCPGPYETSFSMHCDYGCPEF